MSKEISTPPGGRLEAAVDHFYRVLPIMPPKNNLGYFSRSLEGDHHIAVNENGCSIKPPWVAEIDVDSLLFGEAYETLRASGKPFIPARLIDGYPFPKDFNTTPEAGVRLLQRILLAPRDEPSLQIDAVCRLLPREECVPDWLDIAEYWNAQPGDMLAIFMSDAFSDGGFTRNGSRTIYSPEAADGVEVETIQPHPVAIPGAVVDYVTDIVDCAAKALVEFPEGWNPFKPWGVAYRDLPLGPLE